jgi:ketosteroid isomerase-like protein
VTPRNVELLRLALCGGSGPDSFYGVLATEIEWDVSRAPGDVSVVRGRDAVRTFMPVWRHGWEHWRFEEEDFVDLGDRVVTIARSPSGPDRAAVWTFEDGEVVRFAWYEDASEALTDASPSG